MRLLHAASAAVAVATMTGGALMWTGSSDHSTVAASDSCQMKSSLPDSGRIELELVRPSTENADRNDYRLTATVRWNDQAALDCFAAGRVDWAYEHEILYGQWFDRKIWNENFSSLPRDAGPYLDTTASDRGDVTTLSIGIFRPETLTAGRAYSVSYELFLPNDPPGGVLPLTLEGEVIEKNCSDPGPWCVGARPLPRPRQDRDTFVGAGRGFSVNGDCWSWARGQAPTRCSAPDPPITQPPTSTPTTTPVATAPQTTTPPSTTTSSATTAPPATHPTPPPTDTPSPSLSLSVDRHSDLNPNCEPTDSTDVRLIGVYDAPILVRITNPAYPDYSIESETKEREYSSATGNFRISNICNTPGIDPGTYNVDVVDKATGRSLLSDTFIAT